MSLVKSIEHNQTTTTTTKIFIIRDAEMHFVMKDFMEAAVVVAAIG